MNLQKENDLELCQEIGEQWEKKCNLVLEELYHLLQVTWKGESAAAYCQKVRELQENMAKTAEMLQDTEVVSWQTARITRD